MSKIWLVFKREYLTRVKNKTFLLVTLLMPLGFLAILGLPILMENLAEKEVQRVAVVDESGYFEQIANFDNIEFVKETKSVDELKKSLEDYNYDGVLLIPSFDINEDAGFEYYSNSVLGITSELYLNQYLGSVVEAKRFEQAGIDKIFVDSLRPNIKIKSTLLGVEGEEKQLDAARFVGYGVGFVMYMVLLIYGMMVMRGVLEEKTSRIVEVVISSVKPFQLMIGKILGIAAVGLTQLAIWSTIVFTFVRLFGEKILGSSANIQEINLILEQVGNIDISVVVLFLIYFIFGYMMYAAIFAAVGSIGENESDVQNLTFPAILPIIAAFMIGMTANSSPDSSLAFWASIVPFTSPIVMPVRISYGVGGWEIAVSLALLTLTFVIMSWFAAKVYRTGILMYGKKVRLSEIWKWLFYKD